MLSNEPQREILRGVFSRTSFFKGRIGELWGMKEIHEYAYEYSAQAY